MDKSSDGNGKASVTFTLDPQIGAGGAAVCGEFNDWSPDGHVMEADADGGFHLVVELDTGRSYRFRYLLDGDRWENDWSADAYVPNDFGSDDSVIDLTAPVMSGAGAAGVAGKPPRAKKAAAPKKAGPPTAAAPAKRAAKST